MTGPCDRPMKEKVIGEYWGSYSRFHEHLRPVLGLSEEPVFMPTRDWREGASHAEGRLRWKTCTEALKEETAEANTEKPDVPAAWV